MKKTYKMQITYSDERGWHFTALWTFSLDYEDSIVLPYTATRPTKLHGFTPLNKFDDLLITAIWVNNTNLLTSSITMGHFVEEKEEMQRIDQAEPGCNLDIEITRVR